MGETFPSFRTLIKLEMSLCTSFGVEPDISRGKGGESREFSRGTIAALCASGTFVIASFLFSQRNVENGKGKRALLLILGSDRKSAMPFPHLSLHPESPTHWWKETTMVSFSSRGLFRAHMPRKWLHQIVRAEFPAVGEGRNNIICYESGAERVPLCLVNRNEPPIFHFLFLKRVHSFM